MILHRYFARRFLIVFSGLFILFLFFVALVDLIEQVRIFEGIAFRQVVFMTLLNTPQSLYQMLPLVVILSTIGLYLGLARSSELVVARAAGRSGLLALVAPVLCAGMLGGISVTMFNPIVAATNERYDQQREFYESDGTATLSIGKNGLWLRQGSELGQTVIHANRSAPDASILYDVTFVALGPAGAPQRRIIAEQAQLTDDGWLLQNAKAWPLIAELNSEVNSKEHARLIVPSTLTQERIVDSFGKVSSIPIWELPEFIQQLEAAGFSARRHAVWLHMELARPLFLMAMVLVGAAFTMRPVRSGKTGLAVLSAVLLGFTLYYLRNFAQVMGEVGQIPVLLAAWAPPVSSVLLAMGVLLHMEDG
ncbi:MAG: LPS export ABC transporter permease LptG [Marinovum sp.]|nr:LPS export ABC transporter permease LptG [Marinovum sp.]